jgi:hypothetical protein
MVASGFALLCTLLFAARSRSVLQKERKDLCVLQNRHHFHLSIRVSWNPRFFFRILRNQLKNLGSIRGGRERFLQSSQNSSGVHTVTCSFGASLRAKAPDHEVNHSPQVSADVKCGLSPSTSCSHSFIACTRTTLLYITTLVRIVLTENPPSVLCSTMCSSYSRILSVLHFNIVPPSLAGISKRPLAQRRFFVRELLAVGNGLCLYLACSKVRACAHLI